MTDRAATGGLLDDAPVAVVSVDLARRIDSWNREAERLFGWPANEVVGRDPLELIVGSIARDVGEAA
jgi:PAS domain S-box-containing protein